MTGIDYEYRRAWIRERFEFLAGIMGIEVLGYAVMSNLFHVVLRNRPDVVAEWCDEEIAARWWQLCPGRRNKDRSPAKPTEQELQALILDKVKRQEYRQRLSSVSWFMRFVTESVARRANADESDASISRIWRWRCRSRNFRVRVRRAL